MCSIRILTVAFLGLLLVAPIVAASHSPTHPPLSVKCLGDGVVKVCEEGGIICITIDPNWLIGIGLNEVKRCCVACPWPIVLP